MKTKLTDRPVEQVIAAIHALDLESVKIRMMDPELGEGWTREYAEGIEQGYRNYLTMLVKHPEDAEDLVVSKDVDKFWHTHILHTMKYTEDCEGVFGHGGYGAGSGRTPPRSPLCISSCAGYGYARTYPHPYLRRGLPRLPGVSPAW